MIKYFIVACALALMVIGFRLNSNDSDKKKSNDPLDQIKNNLLTPAPDLINCTVNGKMTRLSSEECKKLQIEQNLNSENAEKDPNLSTENINSLQLKYTPPPGSQGQGSNCVMQMNDKGIQEMKCTN